MAFELALRFPGQQATDASGLFHTYRREYDPAVGWYSQSDPIGLRGASALTLILIRIQPLLPIRKDWQRRTRVSLPPSLEVQFAAVRRATTVEARLIQRWPFKEHAAARMSRISLIPRLNHALESGSLGGSK